MQLSDIWEYLTNYAHVHILLNHFPSIGTVFGVALFAYALWKKNQDLQILSFIVFMIMAVLAIPTVITGAAASIAITERPDLNPAMVQLHLDAAVVAVSFISLTGTFSWLALWQYRRFKAPSQWTVWAVLGLSIITLAFMVKTGDLGGEISHPEIRGAGAPEVSSPPEGQEGLGFALQSWVVSNSWVFPMCETLHFIGLSLLFGVALLINARLLGVLKGVPFSTIHRFLPLGVIGFGMTAISGWLMFNSNPIYAEVPAFFVKMFLVVVAGVSVLYVTIFDDTWALGEGADLAPRHKIFAVVTTLVLLGVMYLGRMLPYLGSGN